MTYDSLVSVVIPTLRRPALLIRAIRSVLAQTYPRFEIVVVVDGPDLATKEALDTIVDARLRPLQSPQRLGAAMARNLGVSQATGDWIAFLDDDDEWLPKKLEVQVAAARIANQNVCCLPAGISLPGASVPAHPPRSDI